MPYLIYKLTLLILLTTSVCNADNTIIIKKYKRPSRSLLDRKIIYMDMGTKPTPQAKNSSSLSDLASPSTTLTPPRPQASTAATNQVKSLNKKSYQVKKLVKDKFNISKLEKKTRLSSLGKGIGQRASSSENDFGEYNEDDWGEYTEYRDVVLEESLGVSARIKH